MPAEEHKSAINVYKGINEIKELDKKQAGQMPILQFTLKDGKERFDST